LKVAVNMPMLAVGPRRVGSAAAVAVIYLACSAMLMLVNASTVSGLELPWTWYWLLWGSAFAPPAVLVALPVAKAERTSFGLLVFVAAAMLVILAVMEVAFLKDLQLPSVLLAVVLLSLSVVLVGSRVDAG
jgi:hypothetical protein